MSAHFLDDYPLNPTQIRKMVVPDSLVTPVLSAGASAASVAVTVTKLFHEVKNTPADVKTCLALVATVDVSLQHLVTLCTQHESYLLTAPDDRERVYRILRSAKDAIVSVAQLLEGCRAEAHGGSIPLSKKLKWVMSDSRAFVLRSRNLAEQHASLVAEISFLRQVGLMRPVLDEVEATTFENMDLLCMKSKKRTERSTMSVQSNETQPPAYSPPPIQTYMCQLPVIETPKIWRSSKDSSYASSTGDKIAKHSREPPHNVFELSADSRGWDRSCSNLSTHDARHVVHTQKEKPSGLQDPDCGTYTKPKPVSSINIEKASYQVGVHELPATRESYPKPNWRGSESVQFQYSTADGATDCSSPCPPYQQFDKNLVVRGPTQEYHVAPEELVDEAEAAWYRNLRLQVDRRLARQ